MATRSKNLTKSVQAYSGLLDQIKTRIRQSQTRAILSANAEMIRLYWDVGGMLIERQSFSGWGSGVLEQLAGDIRNELPEVKGFSRRNLFLMTQFHREYPNLYSIVQQPAAQLPAAALVRPGSLSLTGSSTKVQQPAALLPWFHNVLLMQKVKDKENRLWYMQQTLQHGWSRNTLALMIDSRGHERQGKAVTNFQEHLLSA